MTPTPTSTPDAEPCGEAWGDWICVLPAGHEGGHDIELPDADAAYNAYNAYNAYDAAFAAYRAEMARINKEYPE